MNTGIRLDKNMAGADATEKGLGSLLHKEGTAASGLRPAGIAEIDGKRVDVVTQGEMIAEGDRIQVTEVKGNRVVVRRTGKEK